MNIFGDIFGESIDVSSRRRGSWVQGNDHHATLRGRKLFILLFFFGGMGLLFVRLFVLMILHGPRYRALAQENRVHETRIAAPRGILYDRNGIPLVRNIPIFIGDQDDIVYEKPPERPDVHWIEAVGRDYPYGPAFSHVVGYVGEISGDQLKEFRYQSYRAGDVIGKMGIEDVKDREIRGTDGKELMETDALGQKVRRLGIKPPVAGDNLTLTLHRDLQLAAAAALGELPGAIIATIPSTGELLVLYSSPSFDPNALVRGEGSAILQRTDQPLFDRAVSGQYPPGSTFKIITAVAALESRSISHDTYYEDTGVLTVGSFSFGNWYHSQYGKTEGSLNIVGALKRSNDIFFYHAAQATGIETLAGWAKTFGLGKPLGIDLTGEMSGLMPDPVWSESVKKEPWYLGNTYHVAIGQGDVLATPLQVNSWAGVIATGGKLCRPHVLQNKNDCKDVGISRGTIDLIREGMKQACAPGGTGWPLFKFKVKNPSYASAETAVRENAEAFAGRTKYTIDNIDYFEPTEGSGSGELKKESWVEIPVACKTGTAEFGHPENKTHAWLTAYAPLVNPQISVTVLVEQGGEGSTNAAPIAKKVLEAWFTR